MKTLRIIGAAFMVLLGAMLLVAWSVAGKTVSAIESGEAANNLTQKLLDDPQFSTVLSEAVVDGLDRQTEGRFINRIVVAFRPELEQIVKNVLESDRVNEAVTNSVDRVSTQLTQELTEPNRPSGPFTLSIDISDRVNQRIDEIPVVGTFIPDVTVPPIEKELIPAESFDQMRSIFGAVKFVATWGLLFGLVLIIGGFFVAPRSRWYWPQAALGAGILVLGVSIVVRRVLPSQIANSLPGGSDSGGPAFVKNFLSDNATGPIASRLLAMAVWAIVLAVLFWAIARYLPERIPAVRAAMSGKGSDSADAEFVPPVGIPDAVVAETVVVAEPVASHAQVVDTVVIEQDASAPATQPEPELEPEPEPKPDAAAPAVVEAPARKPAPKKAPPVKPAPAKAAPAKAAPAKATPAKKPAAASGTPKPTRTRKPPAKPGDAPSE